MLQPAEARKKCPAAVAATTGTKNLDLCKYRPRPFEPQAEAQQSAGEQLPHCPLHGVNIVHRLPDGCPLRHANPFQRLLELKNAAWSQVGAPRFERLNEGLLGLDVVNICERCVPAMLANNRIKQLRQTQNTPPHDHSPPPGGDGRTSTPRIRGRVIA